MTFFHGLELAVASFLVGTFFGKVVLSKLSASVAKGEAAIAKKL